MKQKSGQDGDNEAQPIEITVYDYFVHQRHIKLRDSADFPCINVGKPRRPSYIPVEVIYLELYDIFVYEVNYIFILFVYSVNSALQLCSLVSLQRYTKALSTQQRASLVEKSRQKPQERMRVLTDVGFIPV